MAGLVLLILTLPVWSEPTSQPSDEEPMDDFDLLNMDIETVVTGMRRKQDIKDMPYAVSVVSAEEIRRSGARSVPDALRLVPGIDIADLQYGISTVSPRGFYSTQSNQALVLVDGRQICDSFFGGTVWGA